jgi:hypothetical protein
MAQVAIRNLKGELQTVDLPNVGDVLKIRGKGSVVTLTRAEHDPTMEVIWVWGTYTKALKRYPFTTQEKSHYGYVFADEFRIIRRGSA